MGSKDDFTRTVLYSDIDGIMSPEAFGGLLFGVGVLVAIGFLLKKARLISWFSGLQSLIWLFVTSIYWTKGQYFLGAAIAFVWVLMSSYMAYAHKNQDFIIRQSLDRVHKK